MKILKTIVEALDPKQIPFVRSANNYDTKAVSDATGLHCPEPTLTQQQFKDDANPNVLLEKFKIGEILEQHPLNTNYGDFTQVTTYEEAHDLLRQAEHEFMQLPLKIRNRFENNPQKLMDFLNNPENRDEAIALKLIESPKADPAPDLDLKGSLTPKDAEKASGKAPKGDPKDT